MKNQLSKQELFDTLLNQLIFETQLKDPEYVKELVEKGFLILEEEELDHG